MFKKKNISANLAEFRKYLSGVKSEKTISSYLTWLRKFEVFLQENNITIENCSELVSQEFINYLINNNYKPNSIETACVSLKSYSKWLYQKKIIKNKLIEVQRPKKIFEKKFRPTIEELNNIINIVAKLEDPNKTIIMLFPLIGLRVSELVSIRLDKISRELNKKKNKTHTTITVIGKGNKIRTVPLSEKANNILIRYLKNYRSKTTSEWLFPSKYNNKRHVTSESVQKTIRKIRDEAGVPRLTSHSFRRYFGSFLSSKNTPLATIATLMGHSNIQTTYKHYIEPDQQELIDAVETLDN